MRALNAVFPFSLNGPQFLGFFLAYAILLFVALRIVTRLAESGAAPKLQMSDPYQIAYLRGGAAEALRVITFALMDRELLKLDGGQAVVASAAAARVVRHPAERWVMSHFASPKPPGSVDERSMIDRVDAHYRPKLEQLRLLPDDAARRFRLAGQLVLIAALLGMAGLRMAQTLAAGHSNLLFLAILLGVSLFIAWRKPYPRLTARGQTVMGDLRTLFAALRRRAAQLRPGGKKTDAVMVAAVFGAAILSSTAFAFAQQLWPKQDSSGGSSGGCGSSGCGSSGGSCGGGGGGCGGGGCGS